MVDAFLYKLLTKVDEKSLIRDPVFEALDQAIDDLAFRFNYASRDETYLELLSRLSYRIDLICNQAEGSTDDEQYRIVHGEVYDLVKSFIQNMSEEEQELDFIPY